MADEGMSSLKHQGFAALLLVVVALFCVLGMVVLNQFQKVVTTDGIIGDNSTHNVALNNTIKATLTAFTAALALFGTFASITTLIIAIKVVISVVKGLR